MLKAIRSFLERRRARLARFPMSIGLYSVLVPRDRDLN